MLLAHAYYLRLVQNCDGKRRISSMHMHCLKMEVRTEALMQDAHTCFIETQNSQIILNMRLLLFFSPNLSAACVVRQLALLNLRLCRRCLHCLAYACVAGPNQTLMRHLRKYVKYYLLTEGIESSEM